jgi:hypothetical protein
MTRLNFNASEEITGDLKARGSISESIREALARYFYMLAEGRRTLSPKLGEPELSLLVDIHNGTFWEPHTLDVVRWAHEDAEPEYFEKWGVDRAAFTEKMNTLTPVECAALVDAIERFWLASGTGMKVEISSLLGLEKEGEE